MYLSSTKNTIGPTVSVTKSLRRKNLVNTVHLISVYVYMTSDEPEKRPQLRGGPLLEDTFYFEQMHFHWGEEDVWGSEHFIDGQRYLRVPFYISQRHFEYFI